MLCVVGSPAPWYSSARRSSVLATRPVRSVSLSSFRSFSSRRCVPPQKLLEYKAIPVCSVLGSFKALLSTPWNVRSCEGQQWRRASSELKFTPCTQAAAPRPAIELQKYRRRRDVPLCGGLIDGMVGVRAPAKPSCSIRFLRSCGRRAASVSGLPVMWGIKLTTQRTIRKTPWERPDQPAEDSGSPLSQDSVR